MQGPYVLVGQSIGGLLVRLYTAQYSGDVMGVVLVDPTHKSDMLGRCASRKTGRRLTYHGSPIIRSSCSIRLAVTRFIWTIPNWWAGVTVERTE